jgi:hypothetical protein
MSQPGIEPGPPRWEAITLEKSYLKSLFCRYLEPLQLHGCPSVWHAYTPQGAKAQI